MSNRVKQVGVSDALSMCQTLHDLVKISFGPNALSTLLSSTTGNICITNDGVALMQSINFESPIAKMILNAVIAHHRLMGDSSKSFVFILTEILREISTNLTTVERASDISKLRDGFVKLNTVLQTTVLQELRKHARFYEAADMKEACRSLVQTTMRGKFDLVACKILSDITVNLVTDSCQTSINQSVCDMIDDFADLFLKISGQPVSMSRIISGIVIQQDFRVHFKELLHTPINFILLNCSLENTSPKSNTTIYWREQNQIRKAFTYSTTLLEQRLKSIRDIGIDLILTTDHITDSAKHLCSQYNISVVHLLSSEDVDRVSKFTGVMITSCVDDPITASSIGILKRCEQINVGTKTYVNLVPNSGKFNQVVICAPSPGLVTEYTRAVGNALKVIRMWTDEVRDSDARSSDSLHTAGNGAAINYLPNGRNDHKSSESPEPSASPAGHAYCLVTLPGGGATEFIVSKTLTDYATRHRDDPYLSLAATVMSQAVLSIPRTLHQNSFTSKTRDNWMVILNEAINNINHGNKMISIDGKSGQLIDGFKVGMAVSLTSRMRLYTDVLHLLQQILKIDTVIF